MVGFRQPVPRGSKRMMFLILEDMVHVAFAGHDDCSHGWGRYLPSRTKTKEPKVSELPEVGVECAQLIFALRPTPNGDVQD